MEYSFHDLSMHFFKYIKEICQICCLCNKPGKTTISMLMSMQLNYAAANALLFIRHDELVALAVDVDDFHLFVFLQMFTEFGDIHVH